MSAQEVLLLEKRGKIDLRSLAEVRKQARDMIFLLVDSASFPISLVTVDIFKGLRREELQRTTWDELETLIETIGILSSPELLKMIDEAIEDIERGEVITLEELKKKYGLE